MGPKGLAAPRSPLRAIRRGRGRTGLGRTTAGRGHLGRPRQRELPPQDTGRAPREPAEPRPESRGPVAGREIEPAGATGRARPVRATERPSGSPARPGAALTRPRLPGSAGSEHHRRRRLTQRPRPAVPGPTRRRRRRPRPDSPSAEPLAAPARAAPAARPAAPPAVPEEAAPPAARPAAPPAAREEAAPPDGRAEPGAHT